MKLNFYPRPFVMALIGVTITLSAHSQKNFFTAAPELASNFSARKAPQKFSIFTLDIKSFKSYLSIAPREFKSSSSSISVEIPLPNGTTEIFNIFESSILAPEIAAQHPEIKTYTGTGQSHSNYTIRMSFTTTGFNAIILGVETSEVYVEQDAANKDGNVYLIYYSKDAKKAEQVSNNKCSSISVNNRNVPNNTAVAAKVSATGGTLRTFKLAVAVTGEFTEKRGGTQASAFDALVAFVNRLNAVYRRELSVAFNLVSGTNLVYTTKGTPYSGTQIGMLDQNQANIDNVIGNANYDIGHLFTYSGGSGEGLAASESACQSTEKAKGITGLGDGSFAAIFDDQTFDHEIGHQFSMSHTFNSVIPVCTTREATSSVEPGAGATIMSYGFTCSNSTTNDDYEATYQPFLNFHSVSYQQAANFIATLTCFSTTSTGNSVPTIGNLINRTIPKSTPFALAATAADANAADNLTYSWEGTNIGTSVPDATTLNDETQPPFFRSYEPTTSTTRSYPRLSAILDGTNKAKGDKLPSVGIVTTHRFTVRDNKDGVNNSEVSVTVDGNSGPFLETTNLAGTYPAGSTQTITWSVNNTTSAPVSCANVDILLSIDGGQTFPYTLAASTPNDGSENINLPPLATTSSTTRMKVQASNNIFFDISNNNFTITGNPTLPLSLLSLTATKQGNSITLNWTSTSESGLARYEVEYSADAVTFSKLSALNAKNTAGINVYNLLHATPVIGINYYRLRIVNADGTGKYSQTVAINITKSNKQNISIYPNPVKGGYLNLQFNQIASQVITVTLYTNSGQQILRQTITNSGSNSATSIKLPSTAKGAYHLVITGHEMESFSKYIIIQ